MRTDLIIIGGGEHARVVIDAAAYQKDRWHVLGYIDIKSVPETTERCGIPWLGGDDRLGALLDQNPDAKLIFAFGGLRTRRDWVERIRLPESRWATIIHPMACVSPKAVLGAGVVVLARAIVQTGAVVGRHAIINSGAIVEHDVCVGDFAHVAPGAVVGGGCHIGDEAFVGLGSRVRSHISVGNASTVGAGSVVVTDIPDGETVVGVPARRISHRKNKLNISEMCVSPDTTLYEAMSVVGKLGVSIALVVDTEQRLLGVLTDGDVRRALLSSGENLNTPVRKSMNPNFRFVKQSVSRAAALDQMNAMSIRHLPVLDDEKRIVGIHLFSELVGSSRLPNAAVIMAGGKGERLRPITESIPKPMVTVAGRPILEHIVLHLVGAGISEIYLSINYLGNVIEEHFGDGSAYGCQIRYLREAKPLGTGGSLTLLPDTLTEPIIVLNGDLVTQFNVERMLTIHRHSGARLTIAARDYQIGIPYGVLELDGAEVVGLTEKPLETFLVNSGIYVVEPELLKLLPKGQEYLMTSLVEDCLSRKIKVGVHLIEGDWIDVGQHRELAKARGGDVASN